MCTQWWISINCNVCDKRYTQTKAELQICDKPRKGEVCSGIISDWIDHEGGTCAACIIIKDREERERRLREGGEPNAYYESW